MNKPNSRFLWLVLLALALALLAPYAVVRAQSGPPPIPHSLEGRSDCVVCHGTGAAGAPKFPPDHEGRTSAMCLGCHQPSAATGGTPGAATPAASSTGAANSTPAAQGQPTAAAGGPPNIPHSLQNRDNCLACHKDGLAGAPKVPASHAGRTVDMCRGCHQPAASAGGPPLVVPTVINHPPAQANQNSCVNCHSTQGGSNQAIVQDWKTSIHSERGVGCADCHGGDPNATTKEDAMSVKAGFVGAPKKVDIPALCASCHSDVEAMRQYDLTTDEWAQYQQSVHGKRLAQGDLNVATCTTCHDGHGTKAVNDPSSQVYPENVPALCAGCHANADLMKPYGIPTNQYDLYKQSVHGIALLQNQDARAPSCATCHGTHGAAPPGLQEVSNVCGSCHSATQDYYLKGAHASNKPGTPKCVTCHGRYDVMMPTEAIFEGSATRQCGSCHLPGSPQAETVQSIDKSITSAAKAVADAEAAIKSAQAASLITAPEEVKLAEARTSLITARAAQHTLDLKTIQDATDKAQAKAKEILDDSAKAQQGLVFRSEFMVFGLVVMALAIGSLYVIRRELYKQLPKHK
ncbi:MAG: cytochrome c3 family protein [Anaerolineae bacterium]